MKHFFADTLLDSQQVDIPQVSADQDLITTVLTWSLALAAAICFLIIIIAGFQFIISRGTPDKITKARQTIIYAVVGLAISLSGTIIVGFIAGRLG